MDVEFDRVEMTPARRVGAVAAAGAVAVWISLSGLRGPDGSSWWWLPTLIIVLIGAFLAARATDEPFPGTVVHRASTPDRLSWGLRAAAAVFAVVTLAGLWPDYRNWRPFHWTWLLAIVLLMAAAWLTGGDRSQPRLPSSARSTTQTPMAGATAQLDISAAAPGHDARADRRWGSPAFSTAEICGVVALCLLGLALRVYRLDEIPAAIFVDETNASLDALRILQGNDASPFGTGWYETPNGYIYGLAAIYDLFGISEGSLKLASILPAVITLPLMWMVARSFFGRVGGIAALGLLATNRWHLTMSRWGWNEVVPPIFILLSVFFLWRAFRARRNLDYALAGLFAGLMLYTYLNSRLALAALIATVVLWALTDPAGPSAGIRAHWRGSGWFGASALLAAMPLLITYITDPFTFNNRSREVVIFTEIDEVGNYGPLWRNLRRYGQMLFQFGDENGRHNLPGEPMLDIVTAALVLLGLGLALWRWRDRRLQFSVLLLVLALIGGVLTRLESGGPNAYRTMNALPAAILLATAAIVALWKVVDGHLSRRARIGGLTVLLAVASWNDVGTYFGPQADSTAVQNAFNHAETAAGQQIRDALDDGARVYVSPRFYGWSVPTFLTADKDRPLDERPYGLIRPETDLALMGDAQDTVILLDMNYQDLLGEAGSLYPDLETEIVRGPGETPLFLKLVVPGDDPTTRSGWLASFDGPEGWSDTTRVSLDDPWPADASAARLTARLIIPTSGIYDLQLGDGQLTVDGVPWSGARHFGRGQYSLAIESAMPTSLQWVPPEAELQPVPPNLILAAAPVESGLRATVFASSDAAEPLYTQVMPFLLGVWPEGEPLPTTNFRVRYEGRLLVPETGEYRLRVFADDSAEVFIDGEKILGDHAGPFPQGSDTAVTLTEGEHELIVDYIERGGANTLELFWTPPGEPERPVPSSALAPAGP